MGGGSFLHPPPLPHSPPLISNYLRPISTQDLKQIARERKEGEGGGGEEALSFSGQQRFPFEIEIFSLSLSLSFTLL